MIDYTKAFAAKESRGFDQGLRDYMLKVYNYMALALLLTGVFAFGTLNFSPLMGIMYDLGPSGEPLGISGFGTLITFAPLGIALFFFSGIGNMSVQKAQTLFWGYAALMGMSLSSLGIIYTGESLARTFFICAAVFGAMSIYGHTTKKDLTSFGSFLMMGLIGIIIASLVNIFLQSPAVQFAVSLMGVGIFMGITAWDTQRLKEMYYQSGGGEATERLALLGAFILYLDFVNLFLHMLRFFGKRR